MKVLFTLIVAAVIAIGGYAAYQKWFAPAPKWKVKREYSAEERRDNYSAKRWERFEATMITPSRDGQLMRKPDGTTIHVPGDLRIAQGEKKRGYFERSGNYENVAGGAGRVQNYLLFADAVDDMGADLIEMLKLKTKLVEGAISDAEISRLAELQVQLKAEGESPILLK